MVMKKMILLIVFRKKVKKITFSNETSQRFIKVLQSGLLVVASILAQVGCSTFTPPSEMEKIQDTGTYWLTYNSDRRGALVRTSTAASGSAKINICAEPAPDTSSNFELQGVLKKETVGELSGQTGQSVIILPGRTSNVLSLRESLYRLCELSLNRPDIPAAELMNAYNKVILAITQYAEADVAKSTANTEAVIRAIAPDTPMSNAFSAAKASERNGFKNIVDGNFKSALDDFSTVEVLYPGYHNAYEIRNALKGMLADDNVSDAEKQAFLRNIVSNWSWGAPNDLLVQIKSQIK